MSDREGRAASRAIGMFFGVLVLLLFLWITRSILVTSFIGLLFAVAIMPAVDWLQRHHVPRGAGAALIVAVFLAVLVGIGALLAPILQSQATELRQHIPQAIDRIDHELATRHVNIGPLRALFSSQFEKALPYLFPFFSTTVSAITGIILVVFLIIFFAADPRTYQRGVLHLIQREHRRRATAVLNSMAHALRSWVMARSIAMVTIGLVVTATMALLGVRAAVALGVIAGILEFVPVFGPIIGAIPAIALALADSPQKALWVTIAFIIIQQLEGNVLIPMLLQKAVEIPPALSLIGIACMVIVLGILGVLIAEPLIAAALVAVKMLYVEPVIGDHMVDEGDRPQAQKK